MKRAVVLIMLAGCGFAQKHPGVTVGVVAGTIGFGACELSVEKIGTCSAIGGAAGLVLGGITGLVTLLADTSAHELSLEEEPPEYTRVRTRTAPPPGLPDTGVTEPSVTEPSADAGVPASPASPADAGAPTNAPDAGAAPTTP